VTPRETRADALIRAIRSDFARTCRTLYMIDPRDGQGLHPLDLWPEQLHQLALMQQQEREGRPVRIVKLKCRQSGDSTFAEAWCVHKILWTARQRAMLVAHDEATTNALFEMSRTIYTELPPELQKPLKKINRRELAFEAPHASSLSAQTAGWIDLGHGRTIQHHHWSEIDLWPDAAAALAGLMETCPMMPGTSIVIEAVASNADGWLRGFWDASKRGDTLFIPIFTPWFKVPEYHLAAKPDTPPLTPEEQEWQVKYGLTPEQIYWYRAKRAEMIAKEPWGGERTMRRMYPFTDEEAFQASGLCVFPDTVLARIRGELARPTLSFRLVAVGHGDIMDVPMTDWEDGDLWVWESPKPECFYGLGVDVSDGVGATESVVSVWRYPGYVQVAEWASSRSSPEQTAWVARFLAEKYGGANALIVPEINKSGVLTLHILQHLAGGFSLFRWRYLNRPGIAETNNPTLGWETNVRTKPVLAQVANMVFLRHRPEAPQGLVRSPLLYEQMKRCVDLAPGRRWTAEGGKVDRILAAMIALVGMYLEFEGGSIGGIAVDEKPQEAKPRPEPGYVDTEWEGIQAGAETARTSYHQPWDSLAH
jgi:hypothetical protein